MGNEQSASHDFSQCGEHHPRTLNKMLNRPCQAIIQLSASVPQIRGSKVLLSYITNDNLLITVDSCGASSHVIESGEMRERYNCEYQNRVVSACYTRDNLILALNIGIITILDASLLSPVKEIKPKALLPGIITAMCEGTANIIIAGHSSGDATMWDIQSGKLVDEFHSGYPPTGVSSIVYCHKYAVIIVGFDNLVMRSGLSSSPKPIKVFSTKSDRRIIDLVGIRGRCLGLVVLEQKNIAIALDSVERSLIIWDFVGGYQLLNTQIPPIFERNIPTALHHIQNFIDEDVVTVGFTNNKVAWSEVLYDGDQLKYFFKWKGKSSIDREGDVATISYSPQLDAFALGNTNAQVYILHNLSDLVYVTPKNPPMFSLKSYQPKVQKVEKQVDLPIVAVGSFQINRGVHTIQESEISPEAPISAPVLVKEEQKIQRTVNEETVKKIRERVEGKKKPNTKKAEQEIVEHKEEKEPQVIESKPAIDTQVVEPQAKIESEIVTQKALEVSEPKKVEVKKKSITPFQRFVQSKKNEFLNEDPNYTHKQIVLKATEQWGMLTEQEKHIYEEERAPDLTS